MKTKLNKDIFFYFLLAFLFSWVISVPLAIYNINNNTEFNFLHYFAAYGPATAVLALYLLKRKTTISFAIKLNLKFLLSVLSPFILLGVSLLVYQILFNTLPNLGSIGEINFLGNIGVIASLFFWIFTFGIGEEIGWRGYATDILQKRFGFKKTVFIVGPIWFLWHIPFFIYNSNLLTENIFSLFIYFLSIMSGAVVLSFIYNVNNRSVIAAAIWHGAFNWVTASNGVPNELITIMGILVLTFAVLILKFYSPKDLN